MNNPESTVEYNSLSWVKAQLDDVLADAQANLNEYIENETQDNLENCVEHLQLIYGTLQMVEVYGGAMLAEEMQLTTSAVLAEKVENKEDAYDVLMRAMLQLPDYLERIQSGGMDAPMALMPLINDLRSVRKEGLLTESALFSPDIDNVELPAVGYDPAKIESGKLASEARRLRTHYQLGLLDYIRNNKQQAGLKRIRAVMQALEKASSHAAVRRLWGVINALAEGLMKEGIASNVTIKMLLGGVDRQIKLLLDVGDAEFTVKYSRDLVKNALYYIGTCEVSSSWVDAVKEAYNLDQLMPHAEDESGAVAGLNADLFDTVSIGITEDLAQVKDVLELFMTSEERDAHRLVPVAEQLGKIADTYGMLGMGATRQSIMNQKTSLDSVINDETALTEQMVMQIASELLNAESELKNYIAERSGFIDVNRKTDDDAVPAAEYRQVVLTVVSEGLKNFSEAKEAVLSYVAGVGNKEQLDIILDKLEEVRGVSLMLSLGRVRELIVKLQHYITVALKANSHMPDPGEQDTVADVVTAIEYFFEALSEGRPGVEQGLSAGEDAASKLDIVTATYGGIASVDVSEMAVESGQSAADDTDDSSLGAQAGSPDSQAEDSDDASADVSEPVAAASDGQAPVSVVTDVPAVSVADYAILSDDADEEIVEIFIEEAVEVLGELHEHMPAWRANHDDEEALAVVRRSFHTLKGSGRLLGAELIGEFSWKFENMLNRVIDKKISVSETLLNALDEALAVLPQLIEQLKGNREPVDNVGELMGVAEALSEGKQASLSAVPVETAAAPATEQAVTEQVVTEQAITEQPVADEAVIEELVAEEPASEAAVTEAEESIDISDAGDNIDISFDGMDDIGADMEADIGDETGQDIAEESAVDTGIDTGIELEADTTADSDAGVEAIEISLDDEMSDASMAFETEEVELSVEDDSDISIDLSDAELAGSDLDGSDIKDIGSSDGVESIEVDDFAVDVSADDTTDVEEIIELSPAGAEDSLEAVDLDVAIPDATLDSDSDLEISEHSTAGEAVNVDSGEQLDIDPMLLKIYYDESQSHIENVRQLLSADDGQAVRADKNLMRAFHTLYGSARTAEIDSIADICGAIEKYVKARQDGGEDEIPASVASLISEVESNVSAMLDVISRGNRPAPNKPLLDRINRVVQDEIQSQLQRSLQQSSASSNTPAVPADMASLAADSVEQIEEVDGDFDLSDLSPDADITDAENFADLSDSDTDSADDSTAGGLDVGAQVEAEVAAEADAEVQANIDAGSTPGSLVDIEQVEKELAREQNRSEAVDEQPMEMSYGDIDDDLIDIFLEEAEELLESCETTLSAIISEPNSTEHIHQLQRNMHTLKGGARMAELTPVGDLTHNLESLVVMVSENKVAKDKALFDLLQEAVDMVTNLLGEVKQRKPLSPVGHLNKRIGMLMRGEVEEKRSVERFDVELSQLEPGQDEEELEDIDISSLLPGKDTEAAADVVKIQTVDEAANERQSDEQRSDEQQKEEDRRQSGQMPQRRADDEAARPHWGERATDVNFKDSQEQVRVRSDLLNNLVNYAGEVNIYHSRMSKQISDFGFNLSELTQTVVRLKEQLRNLEIETEIQIRSGYEKESGSEYDADFDPLEMDQYSTMQQLTRSLGETAGDVESINEILADIARDSETLLMQEARISTDLQEGLMRTRMVRFGGLSSRLRRIVRQVSRELGKEVELVLQGESSEVDRTVLDRIIAPLEHMLRNAVAHGIETPEARKVLGKDESGHITIDVERQGADIVIKVMDDGSGINVDKIREKAIKQGYITADSQLADNEVLQFILQSGFSTAEQVTQVSGRGVGMDVVDSEIKQLGGVLEISTERGSGTTFHIRLPLTLAINQALLVSTNDDVFAVPLASIEGVVRITGLELQRFYDSGNTHYEFNGVEYELKHLGGMLTGNQQDYSKQLRLFPVLLVHVGDQHFALHVDDLLGRREIVVKPVGMQIGGVRGIAGATILPDGRVVLILEMSALVVAESLFKPHEPVQDEVLEEQAAPVADTKKTIMVVDDSITIRKVTERMLARYGIDVLLAKDGVDATNQLQEHIPDLMLLDIEMPRMDGFEVASYVRNDDRLKDIPIIMITSRTGSKHRDKAMEIGVNEYLGKPYQEDDLVSNINKILKTSF